MKEGSNPRFREERTCINGDSSREGLLIDSERKETLAKGRISEILAGRECGCEMEQHKKAQEL